jgi:hypothetical protein
MGSNSFRSQFLALQQTKSDGGHAALRKKAKGGLRFPFILESIEASNCVEVIILSKLQSKLTTKTIEPAPTRSQVYSNVFQLKVMFTGKPCCA